MITKETLEMAALAAGRRIAIAPTGRDTFDAIDADAMMAWRPHTDPGDAARLAVRLDMQVESSHGWMCATVAGWMDWGRSQHDGTEPGSARTGPFGGTQGRRLGEFLNLLLKI